jgi:hypothetical protein
MLFSFNNWAVNMAGVHKLSKNLGATSKFYVPEAWYIVRTYSTVECPVNLTVIWHILLVHVK